MKFIFNILQRNSNWKYVDDWNEWISAENKWEAQDIIERAYPENEGYKCTLIESSE